MSSKISKLKALVSSSGVARSYNWQISIPAIPQALEGVVPEIEAGNLDIFCKECPLPPKVVEVIPIAIKTQKWNVNGLATNEGTIAPTFLIDGNYYIYKLFRMWADLGASAKEDKQLNEVDLQVSCYVQALDGEGNVVMNMKIEDMFVSEIPEQSYTSDSAVMEAFTPTLAYSRSYITDIENPIDSL